MFEIEKKVGQEVHYIEITFCFLSSPNYFHFVTLLNSKLKYSTISPDPNLRFKLEIA